MQDTTRYCDVYADVSRQCWHVVTESANVSFDMHATFFGTLDRRTARLEGDHSAGPVQKVVQYQPRLADEIKLPVEFSPPTARVLNEPLQFETHKWLSSIPTAKSGASGYVALSSCRAEAHQSSTNMKENIRPGLQNSVACVGCGTCWA